VTTRSPPRGTALGPGAVEGPVVPSMTMLWCERLQTVCEHYDDGLALPEAHGNLGASRFVEGGSTCGTDGKGYVTPTNANGGPNRPGHDALLRERHAINRLVALISLDGSGLHCCAGGCPARQRLELMCAGPRWSVNAANARTSGRTNECVANCHGNAIDNAYHGTGSTDRVHKERTLNIGSSRSWNRSSFAGTALLDDKEYCETDGQGK